MLTQEACRNCGELFVVVVLFLLNDTENESVDPGRRVRMMPSCGPRWKLKEMCFLITREACQPAVR